GKTMKRQVSISESEWQVMKLIWSDPPQTLPELLDKLSGTAWSKTTIQTYLARLVKKGALTTRRQGKGYLYYPAGSEEACPLAVGRGGQVSQEELAELKALIDREEAAHGGPQ